MLLVPKLTSNLFLVKAAVTKGNTLKCGCNTCWIKMHEAVFVEQETLLGKLYHLDSEVVTSGQYCLPLHSQKTQIYGTIFEKLRKRIKSNFQMFL